MDNYQFYENFLISKKDRFRLSKKDEKELKEDFTSSKILILGASGSIGRYFTKKITKYNFDKLYLIDKNENDLTELNRQIVLNVSKKKCKKINYICSDITILKIDEFLKKNKITHYLNFSAIKHVRSEEELISLRYMFLTNSKSFLPKRKNYLKKFFSISTDKTVNPTSLLGISKLIMENQLSKFKKKNKNIFVSSVRFANVSFSNGSILKYAIDRINQKKIFGIPETIRRFFITHEEASSLCLKSLLKRNDSRILIPNIKYLKKEQLIKDLVLKMLDLKGYRPLFVSSKNLKFPKINKYFPIFLTKPNTHGQKYYEEFYEITEDICLDKKDKSVHKVFLPRYKSINKTLQNILKFDDLGKIKKQLMKNFKSYKPPKNVIKVSQNL